MSVKSNHKSTNKETARSLPLPVVLAAVLVLVAFLGWQFYAYFGAHTPVTEAKPLRPEFKEMNDWMTQKAKESQGDASKLSPEDQKQLAEKTHGMGATALKNIYEKMKH